MDEFDKVSTSREVCEQCCRERGLLLRWGSEDPDPDAEEWLKNNFYCPVTERTIHNPDRPGSIQPDCVKRVEHLRKARQERSEYQSLLIDPEHSSYSLERLQFSAEEHVYLSQWQKKNKRRPGINGNYTLIEHILCPSDQSCPPPVSQRDAYVAASVIQWLGTNCGKHFLDECEKEIPEVRKSRRVALKLMGKTLW